MKKTKYEEMVDTIIPLETRRERIVLASQWAKSGRATFIEFKALLELIDQLEETEE